MAASYSTITRPKRRLLYASIAAVCWAVLAVAVWAPRKHRWSAAAPTAGVQVGQDTRTFGKLSYLIVTRDEVPIGGSETPVLGWFSSPSGGPVRFEWSKAALVTSALATIFFAILCWMIVRRATDKPLPPGMCDECGYDLRGLPDDAGACPECGSDIASQAVRRTRFSFR